MEALYLRDFQQKYFTKLPLEDLTAQTKVREMYKISLYVFSLNPVK